MKPGRVRAAAVSLAVSAAVLLPIAGGVTLACAGSRDHAALVIDTGSQSLEYCVALTSSSVTGMELIKLASSQYGLQYSLGFGSKAVCQLAGVGVSGGDCFSDFPNFWAYWHGTGSGGWSWASTGAADTSVQAGDVEGWSWGKGTDASSHNAPPSRSYENVCGSIDSDPGSGGSGGDGSGGSGSGGSGSGDEDQGAGSGDGAGADGGTGSSKPSEDSTTGSGNKENPGSKRDPATTDGGGTESEGAGRTTRTASQSGSGAATDRLSVSDGANESPEGLALAAGGSAGTPGGISSGTVLALAAILILAGAGAMAARKTRFAGRHERKG